MSISKTHNPSDIPKSIPVKVLAVSKQQSIESIQALYAAGQRAFGENYLQEALGKIEALSALEIEWHFIGHVQRNKTKKIAECFAWVQSVDSALIAKRLNDARPKDLPPLNVCIEVNISGEESKSGVKPEEMFELAEFIKNCPALTLRGIMCIPAPTTNTQAQENVFKQCRDLFDALNERGYACDTLSMGMSQDYEAAIKSGSTMVRLGTMLFGARTLSK